MVIMDDFNAKEGEGKVDWASETYEERNYPISATPTTFLSETQSCFQQPTRRKWTRKTPAE